MNKQKIGWIGLGKMGIPMAQNLIKDGFEIAVYNRTKDKAGALIKAGATEADSPVSLLEASDVLILMVSDDEAINQLFNGADGLLNSTVSGKIIVNMSTVSPAISKRMETLTTAKGNHYLDAPVSGSLKQATEGSLVIMVGGHQDAYELVKPILNSLGKLSLRVGEIGAGNNAKLAINALLSFHAQGLAEAIVFAKKQGIKTADLLELINNGALGNVFMKIKGDAILQNNYDAVFALKHIAKDLKLAKDAGMDSPLTNAALKTYSNAEPTLGEEDIISIIKQI